MKKLLPLALLLCVSFSMSSFAPVHRHMPVVKKGKLVVAFPITGTTNAVSPSLDYEIKSVNSVLGPYGVTFSRNGIPVGTTYILIHSGSGIYTDSYTATGMESATNITVVALHLAKDGSYYSLDIIPAF